MSPDEFIRELESATRSHDLAHSLSLIDDDAVYWFSNGARHAGKAAIDRAFRENFAAIEGEDYRMKDVVWIAKSDDVAACTFRFEWSGIVRGQSTLGSGRGTLVLVRRGDSWVVKHEHLSKEA
jgi:ketosteroid isomerase-like protein